jgi:hypothetical protein
MSSLCLCLVYFVLLQSCIRYLLFVLLSVLCCIVLSCACCALCLVLCFLVLCCLVLPLRLITPFNLSSVSAKYLEVNRMSSPVSVGTRKKRSLALTNYAIGKDSCLGLGLRLVLSCVVFCICLSWVVLSCLVMFCLFCFFCLFCLVLCCLVLS